MPAKMIGPRIYVGPTQGPLKHKEVFSEELPPYIEEIFAANPILRAHLMTLEEYTDNPTKFAVHSPSLVKITRLKTVTNRPGSHQQARRR